MIAPAIVVIFVTFLLLLHHCFVIFNTCYVLSCFQCYYCYFCVIAIYIVLLLLFFVVLANVIIIAYRFLLLLSLLLHGFCCDHYYRCQSGCCYYYCFCYNVATSSVSLLFLLISLSLRSHYNSVIIYLVALLYFTLFLRELNSYSFLFVPFIY